LWDAESRVAVCGDWCQGARIEGAFLSGLAAADRVLRARGAAADTA
jgi:predicted NAD/FAD-dependent oxidoreductase